MGSSAVRTQVSREEAPARRPAEFQEVPGEAEANAVRGAFLQGSAAPVQIGAALGGMGAAMRERMVERLQRERGNAFVQRLLGASALQREGEEAELQALSIQREEDEELQALSIQREEDDELQALAIQREDEGDEEEVQELAIQRDGEEDELQALSVQREAGGAGALVGLSQHDMVSEVQRRKGSGSALPDETRSEMEGCFGADLSGVRLHTDSAATSLSRELNAQAFTAGKDIFFGDGKFNPSSSEGKATLAHELTHVGQQGGFGAPPAAAQREREALQALALQREDQADEEEVQELALQRQSEQDEERDV